MFLSTKKCHVQRTGVVIQRKISTFFFAFGEFCPNTSRDDRFPALEHYLRKGEKPALVIHGKTMKI